MPGVRARDILNGGRTLPALAFIVFHSDFPEN